MILLGTGMTNQQYGFAISCFSIAYMIRNPIWGFVLDRKGLRVGMAVAVCIWSIASFAHAVVGMISWLTVPLQFALARLVLGAGEGATCPGAMRTACMTLPPHQQATGVSIGYSGTSLGAIVTPLIVTPIALGFGWRAAFWVTGFIGLGWVIAWLITSRRYPALNLTPAVRRTTLPKLSERPIWAFLVLYSFGAIPFAVVIYAAPIFLSRVMSMSQSSLGHRLWIPPLGWELGYLFWGWTVDRSGKAIGRVVFVLALASVITAIVPLSSGPASALACLFGSMFVAAGFVMCSLKYGLQQYPSNPALLAGIGPGAWSGLVAILMPVIGSMFDAGRYATVFAAVSCFPLVGAVIWAWLARSRGAES
jgi:MFS transporter, ACS family, aldohexuronate transporter